MAIEDGLVLARCVKKYTSDPVIALDRYEAARRERTTEIVRRSANMAATFHNDALSDSEDGANYIASNWNPDKIRMRYDTIYKYDPWRSETRDGGFLLDQVALPAARRHGCALAPLERIMPACRRARICG